MKKIDSRVVHLRKLFDIYYENLHTVCKMIPPQSDSWIPWFIDIFTDKRDELSIFLKHHNIQTRPTYPEINKTPMYYSDINLPISSYVTSNGLFLPSHTLLTENDIQYICNVIKLFYTV